MSATLTYVGTLTVTSCWCGIGVAIPSDLYNEAQRDGKAVYCPLGHTFVYRDTTRKQLERALQREEATRQLLEHEQRSHAASKGHLTRKKRQLDRVTRGVCPCCSRHFANLERHMQSQHPDFKPADEMP